MHSKSLESPFDYQQDPTKCLFNIIMEPVPNCLICTILGVVTLHLAIFEAPCQSSNSSWTRYPNNAKKKHL